MPRSTPTTASGRAGVRSARSTSQVNATYQRPPSRRTVADMIRAVPASTRRASLRADSCSFNRPSRGSTTCIRSGSTRIAPVVNRTDRRRAAAGLEPGEPDRPAGALAAPGVRPVLQRPRQGVQAGVERLLGALGPPRRHRRPWRRSTPCAARQATSDSDGVSSSSGHAVGALGGPLAHVRLDPRQCPVVRDPRRPGMREHGALLRRGQVQGEPVRLDRSSRHRRPRWPPRPPGWPGSPPRAGRTGGRTATSGSRSRPAPGRRPPRPGRPPAGAGPAPPARPRRTRRRTGRTGPGARPRSSTRPGPAAGPGTSCGARSAPTRPRSPPATPRGAGRWPRWSPGRPAGPGRPSGRPTTPGRTRPPRRRVPVAATGSPTMISRPSRYVGTGSVPAAYCRRAVMYATPCDAAHSFKFT